MDFKGREKVNKWIIEQLEKLSGISEDFRIWLHERSNNDVDQLRYVEGSLMKYVEDVASGYNKTTIIFNEDTEYGSDWVVKFPKNVTPEDHFNRTTACDREADFYEEAYARHLENFFAECWKSSFKLDGEEIPFYVMQRVNIDEDAYYSLSDDEGGTDGTWNAFYNLYGEIAGELVSFCEEFDINDLHEGNVGFIDDDLVLIDYSGYISGEEDDYEEW